MGEKATSDTRRSRKMTALITLDMEKAFNSAAWEKIMEELAGRDFTPYLLRLVRSYLSNGRIQIESGDEFVECEINSGYLPGFLKLR